MRKKFFLTSGLLFIIFNISLTIAAQNDQILNKAINFVHALEVENYSEATADFDAKMKEVFSSEKLEVTWKTVVSQAGAFKRIVNTQIDKSHQFDPESVSTFDRNHCPVCAEICNYTETTFEEFADNPSMYL